MENVNNLNVKNKYKIFIIVFIILLILLGIFVGFKLFFKPMSNDSNVVSIGEELRIKRLNRNFDFSVKVLSPLEKKSIFIEGITDDKKIDVYALKVEVKNHSDMEFSLDDWALSYHLLDSTDGDIDILNSDSAFLIEDAIETKIASGETKTGYLYFYDVLTTIDDIDIDLDRVSKFKINVLNRLVASGENNVAMYDSYFVMLKEGATE